MTLATIPWDFALILAALAVLIPWRGSVRVGRLMNKEDLGTSGRLSLYGSTIFFQWVIAGLVLWRALARGMSRAELGLTIADPRLAAWLTCGATLVLCAGQIAGLRKMVQLPPEKRGSLFHITEKIMPRAWPEAALFAALACTAGLSEEFLYRGFVLALFARLFANAASAWWVASCLSSVWFAAAHLYQGRRGMLTTFVIGMIFAGLRLWAGTLLPAIVAHAGVDLLVGLYIPRLLRKA